MALELQTNVLLEAAPSDPKHLVNAKYVTEFFAGKVKMPVRVIAAANASGTYEAAAKTFTCGAAGALVIDGKTLYSGDRVLLAGQADATQNGIYTVTEAGADGVTEPVLTRADDFNDSNKIYSGVSIAVNEGTLFANTTWKLAADGVITLDATALLFINAGATVGTAKHSETITGDGVTDEFAIDHDLGTTDISVSIFNLVTNAMVLADVIIEDNNTVVIGFAVPPTAAQVYRVTIIG